MNPEAPASQFATPVHPDPVQCVCEDLPWRHSAGVPDVSDFEAQHNSFSLQAHQIGCDLVQDLSFNPNEDMALVTGFNRDCATHCLCPPSQSISLMNALLSIC